MCPWQFLRARWQSDPCYAFYAVDGSTCSILVYLSRMEDFCPSQPRRNHTAVPWHHKPPSSIKKVALNIMVMLDDSVWKAMKAVFFSFWFGHLQASIRDTLSPLYDVMNNSSSPAVRFMRSRVERMSDRWIWAGKRMKQDRKQTVTPQMKVVFIKIQINMLLHWHSWQNQQKYSNKLIFYYPRNNLILKNPENLWF